MNTGLVIHSERGSALGRVVGEREVKLVRGDRDVFGVHGRSAEQRLAIDLLLDPEIGILSLGGRAGTGKSALALCAGLEMVLERQQHKKIMVFRPLYAVGGQELGYLPGDQGEKMNPWGQAVFDTLGSVVSDNVLDEVVDRGILEVLPLTHIRGRSLHDAFVIVDEAQSLERNVLLTVLSRIGQNSRVVLTHDVAQRDNLRVGRHDGVASVIETLKGHPLFAHITLTRSERSAIAALVSEMLDGAELHVAAPCVSRAGGRLPRERRRYARGEDGSRGSVLRRRAGILRGRSPVPDADRRRERYFACGGCVIDSRSRAPSSCSSVSSPRSTKPRSMTASRTVMPLATECFAIFAAAS